jgi:hypothetical protein
MINVDNRVVAANIKLTREYLEECMIKWIPGDILVYKHYFVSPRVVMINTGFSHELCATNAIIIELSFPIKVKTQTIYKSIAGATHLRCDK